MSPKSKPTSGDGPRVCGIADALGLVGDRWALLVLRELGLGVHRFNDVQANTGAPRDSLATRLRELEEAGLISRRRYSAHPPRDEYLLTDAGRALGPVLNELRIWGETYARPVTHTADARRHRPEAVAERPAGISARVTDRFEHTPEQAAVPRSSVSPRTTGV